MLDTNILIYLLKNKPPEVAQRVNELDAGAELCMSFVTYAELLKGAERSTRKERVLKQIEQLIRIIPVKFDLKADICHYYAIHFTKLKLAGTPIGGNDLWIACHALACQAVLVTNNVREFKRVSGLKIENWVD
ncbi:MAG: type II toxin-antitoxin system VapC family toxin [Methylococcales bacterium]|nr:type II toxin-antitoxin system VapC family toxin [Methylococcales bacterium]